MHSPKSRLSRCSGTRSRTDGCSALTAARNKETDIDDYSGISDFGGVLIRLGLSRAKNVATSRS